MTLKPLPKQQKIEVKDIPTASALIYFGGTKATEFYGNYRYKFPYRPAPFHAALYCQNGVSLQVGKFKTIKPVEEGFKSTRRIDVIYYRHIPEDVRARISKSALIRADDPKFGINLPTYGWSDFMRFEPLLRFLPKSKNDICSEDTWKSFKEYGYVVANKPRYTEVAPWDLYVWALENTDKAYVFTLHEGPDFVKKFSGAS